MIIKILGTLIGALILGAGLYYLVKNRRHYAQTKKRKAKPSGWTL